MADVTLYHWEPNANSGKPMLALEEKGDHAIVELRKHLVFYLRGIHDAAKLRTRINACKTLEELQQIWG